MKKQYIFFLLLLVMLYLMYLIINYKYREYLINSNIEHITTTNSKISAEINKNKEVLAYLNTESYRNKILKKEQGLKNQGEKVIYITTESQYEKYILLENTKTDNFAVKEENLYDNMTNLEKWVYFVFLKDIRK